tara:strand:- start:119798 stop:120214 length:417 start_codon:yes stop_codon:yes gene_type:complete
LGTPIPVDPIFQPPEHHLHKNGLRTYPSTKDTPKGHGEEGYKNDPNDHGDHKEVKILWPERKTKYIEPALQYIEHHKLVSVDGDKGSGNKYKQQDITYPFSVSIEPAPGLFGKYPSALSLFAYGTDGVPKGFVHVAAF